MARLVFHHGALGDGVMLWPVLRGLGAVTWVGPGSQVKLAARWLEGVEPVDGQMPTWSRLFAELEDGQVDCAVARRLGGAELIISFISGPGGIWAKNVRALARGARLVFVRPRPGPDEPAQPVRDYIVAQLHCQGVDVEPVDGVERPHPGGPLVVHPGSGGLGKCWPVERFEQLLGHYRSAGRPVVVLLGPAEQERFDRAVLRQWAERYRVICPADLVALSEVIAGAGVYLGNDSGPTHLAGQLGVKTVAMFGPTDRRIWAPTGPAVRVLAPPEPRGMDWLRVEAVIEAVDEAWR